MFLEFLSTLQSIMAGSEILLTSCKNIINLSGFGGMAPLKLQEGIKEIIQNYGETSCDAWCESCGNNKDSRGRDGECEAKTA